MVINLETGDSVRVSKKVPAGSIQTNGSVTSFSNEYGTVQTTGTVVVSLPYTTDDSEYLVEVWILEKKGNVTISTKDGTNKDGAQRQKITLVSSRMIFSDLDNLGAVYISLVGTDNMNEEPEEHQYHLLVHTDSYMLKPVQKN